MSANSERCSLLADAVRFSRDIKFGSISYETQQLNSVIDHYLRNGLLITPSSAPIIDACVEKVCRNLFLPRDYVKVFVQASAEIQASCLSVSKRDCIVQLSSGLVNLLSEDELSFVIGHEVGHHILEHSLSHSQEQSLELMMQKRAQEISVDRVGLYCCSDISHAMSAMIKTISGLNEKHLGLDIASFISQTKKLTRPDEGEGHQNTHPSLLVRCRALLWFFQPEMLTSLSNGNFNFDFSAINKRVEAELDKFCEGPINKYIDEVVQDLSMWISAEIVLADGSFSKDEQNKFAQEFGVKNLQKLKQLLIEGNKTETMKFIKSQINNYEAKLGSIIPNSFADRLKEIKGRLNSNYL